jgi:hypothetical protein
MHHFKDFVFVSNPIQVHTDLLELCGHKNKDIQRASFQAIDSFLKEV